MNLGNLWGGLFADVGNVWNQWSDVRKGGTVTGVGLGLRYNTPVGPLRIDYGQPLAERATGLGRVYFAFGHLF